MADVEGDLDALLATAPSGANTGDALCCTTAGLIDVVVLGGDA